MHVPDFWDDQSIAQKVSTQYSRLKGRLEQYQELATLVDDLELLLELAHEESRRRRPLPGDHGRVGACVCSGGPRPGPLRGATALQR